MKLTKENFSLMYLIMETNIKVAEYICYFNEDSVMLDRSLTKEEKAKMTDMIKGNCGVITKRMERNKEDISQNYYEMNLQNKICDYFMELAEEENPRLLPRILLNYTIKPRILSYEMATKILRYIKIRNKEYEAFLGEIIIDTFLVKKTKEYIEKYNFTETQAMAICYLGLSMCSEHFDDLVFTNKDSFRKEFESFADKYIDLVFEDFKSLINNKDQAEDVAYTLKK